ncbi:MAG: 5'/3'-nucleotidase SurE [Treponema sp.]|nr:5'/3'-nucleotidase SurE [Treponema sp.]
MNLLLSNDDGFDSQGIRVLAEKLSKKHKVFIVAPDSNRSAVSHHITMFKENTLVKLADNLYTCTGYPVDCVFTGIESSLFGVKIDAVISGINRGANMGTDIIYSGTCAVARQAVLSGVPSVAFSLQSADKEDNWEDNFNFEPLADFAVNNLEKLLSLARTTPPRAFVNVNALSRQKYEEAVITSKLCIRQYNDKVIAVHDKDDKYHTEFIMGHNQTPLIEDTDYGICSSGRIAVSVVYADPVCPEIVDDMEFSL